MSSKSHDINKNLSVVNHPGTLNYRMRVTNAINVHDNNLKIASRLEKIQNKVLKIPSHHVSSDLRYNKDKIKKIQLRVGSIKNLKINQNHFNSIECDTKIDINGCFPVIRIPLNFVAVFEYTKIQSHQLIDVKVVTCNSISSTRLYYVLGFDENSKTKFQLNLATSTILKLLNKTFDPDQYQNIINSNNPNDPSFTYTEWILLLSKITLPQVKDFTFIQPQTEILDPKYESILLYSKQLVNIFISEAISNIGIKISQTILSKTEIAPLSKIEVKHEIKYNPKPPSESKPSFQNIKNYKRISSC
jgi:hypothetical protein